MQIWRNADIDPAPLAGRRIAVIGYGNQGRAQALNLRDGGHQVRVGLRAGSATEATARADGFAPLTPEQAVAEAAIVVLLVPDEAMASAYGSIAPALRPGAALVFAHGMALRFGLVDPRPDLDLLIVAPKGPGRALRSLYEQGRGLPALWAVHRDATGEGAGLALAYGRAIGCGRAGLVRTTAAEECEADLFNEAAVVWGGVPALLLAGWEALVAEGFSPELAFTECVGELRLLADLIEARGFAGMRAATSTAAQFMAAAGGPVVVDAGVRDRMRALLAQVRSGALADAFLRDGHAGGPAIREARAELSAHPIESAWRAVRELSG